MIFLSCEYPLWKGDDFDQCITVDAFQVLLPLVTTGLSAIWLFVQSSRRGITAQHQYTRLPTTESAGSALSDGTVKDSDDEDDFAEHLSLRRTRSRLSDAEIKIDRPSTEWTVVVVEAAVVLGIIGTFVPELVSAKGRAAVLVTVLSALIWVYTLGLVFVRLMRSRGGKRSPTSLWNHTALIYLLAFVYSLLPFRSALIHSSSLLSETLIIIRFTLTCILCIVTASVRKGNTVVVQEITNGLEPSREPVASLFSIISFSWLDGIIWKGFWKPLELEDIWDLCSDDLAVNAITSFRQTKKTANLAWRLLRHFKQDLIVQALWAAFASLFIFAPTLLLRVILEYVQAPKETPKNVAWLFVALLLVTASIVAVGNGQALFIGRRICIRLRAVIIGEVYSKALRRKVTAGSDGALGEKKDSPGEESENQANVGAIINLMAVDSFKVSEVCAYLHYLIAAVPIQVFIAIVLLYQILGWSSIAGISVMLLLMPVNYFISNGFSKIQKKVMAKTDKRIHATNEVLQNIRIIKFFAWGERFGHIVDQSRVAELKQLRNRYLLWAVAATSWYSSPMLITFLSFLSYTIVEKKELNAPIAFTALSLFNVLRVPLDQLADMITNVLQSKVSVDRVEEFLREEETEKFHQLRHEYKEPDAPLIGFRSATFSWGGRKEATERGTSAGFQLQDLDFAFTPGTLNVVAGPTGSGKTSLLMALLGEMTLLNGSVYLPGAHSREDLIPDPETGLIESVAYCAQQPWLLNDSIRENVLFASPYDEERYKAVIAACSLERDFEILNHGDATQVGEKGISLSGGQKQRISLARALYSSSAHLLLDDCLSAVDSHTAKWIYEFCITGPLMEGRTCILVTHNVALCVASASKVVVLENGRLVAQGDPESVISSGALGTDELLKAGLKSRPESQMPSRAPSSIGEDITHQEARANGKYLDQKSKLSKEETKSEGGVDWRVYLLYLSSMGPWWYWIVVVTVFTAQQIGSVATSVWIRQWVSRYDTTATTMHSSVASVPASSTFIDGSHVPGSYTLSSLLSNNGQPNAQQPQSVKVWYYLGVYAAISLTYITLSFFREITVFAGSLKASKEIHQKLLHNIMRAKTQFFDSTPLGQIMNRFSKDIEAIDQEVAPVALGMMHCLGSVVAIVILISVITPGFLFAGVIITALYCLIGTFYLHASRDLKRIESIQRSPLYQHFGETINGVSTIRAYGDERRFVRDNLAKIDAHNRPFWYLWASNRWLGFRVDIAGALVSFFAGAFVVSSVGKIDAGLAGLSLTYAITFTDNILWVVRLYAVNEQNMNSVERIREYLEVDQEAPEIIPERRPPATWPGAGAISFTNYSTRYRRDLDLVLKNISFEVNPGQKVGIVGRTGAGKSSLTLALFRSLEAEAGKIIIDGIDISTIGLRDLRQSITMVPQDPTLFSGTIRSNLDPFGIHTDREIFSALKNVQLINEVPEAAAPVAGDDARVNKNIFLDLQSPVAESGQNLSQGQRQLVCLARALLREPKVLIMDEATGSLDYETDTKIQEIVGRMSKTTTITIAHRLKTVAAYSLIVVLDQGTVKECAHPYALLGDQNGLFYSMCKSSGELETLLEMARKAYEQEQAITTNTV